MGSRKNNNKKNINREVVDKMVQTDEVFFMTEIEQTMLKFIRMFNINIATLSTLCYGVVYNYSQKRYIVDTEPIEIDSDDDEPRIIETVDELTVQKLIEESQKNKNLIYNVMQYKADKKAFQSIKDPQKMMSSTYSIGAPEKTQLKGTKRDISATGLNVVEVQKKVPKLVTYLTHDNHAMSDLNLQPTQPVNPRNIILNKWSKDSQACRSKHRSPVQLLDVQILKPQDNQHKKILQHQRRELQNPSWPIVSPAKLIIPSQPQPRQQNHQRERQSCDYNIPSQTFDQSQGMQNMRPSNEEPHSSSVQLYQCLGAEHYESTNHTSNYQSVNEETQMQQQLDYVMPICQPTAPPFQLQKTRLEYPISLVKKVAHTSEIFNQRPKPICNPRPGHEYVSPHTRAYYPPTPLDRVSFLLENSVDLSCQRKQQLQLHRQQTQQHQQLQHQQMLQYNNQQQFDNRMFQNVNVLPIRNQRLQTPLPLHPPPHPSQVCLLQPHPPSPVVSVSMQAETLEKPTSSGNPDSHTKNVFSYYNNNAANVQPVQIRPSHPPPPIFANNTQNQAGTIVSKEYSGQPTEFAQRSNMRYARIDHMPPGSIMRIPESYTRTSSSDQMWPHARHQYHTAVTPNRSHGTQHYASSQVQNWPEKPFTYGQTSGWPQSTPYNTYDTSRP